MASLGYNVALHRTLAFGIGAFIAAIGGVLYAWWFGQLSPTDDGPRRRPSSCSSSPSSAGCGGSRAPGSARSPSSRSTTRSRIASRPAASGHRRDVQHGDRVHLPRDRHRLARRPDGPLGPHLRDAAAAAGGEPAAEAAAGRGVGKGATTAHGGNRRGLARRLICIGVTQREGGNMRARVEWKLLLPLALLAVGATIGDVGCSRQVGAGQRREGRDHDRLQGCVRVRLRGRHRRRRSRRSPSTPAPSRRTRRSLRPG